MWGAIGVGNFVSTDSALTEAQMTVSARYVAPGRWRYHCIKGAGHWLQRDCPARLNELLLDFLREARGQPRL